MPNKSPTCSTGSLLLIGSTAFTPIARAAADAYELACPHNVTITVNSVNQEAAAAYERACPWVAITVNSVKNADSAYGLTQVQDEVVHHCKDAGSMIAMYDGAYSGTVGLRSPPMGALIFSIVAYRGGPFGFSITPDELSKIFVQGKPGVIAVGRRAGSGSRKAFFANVLHLKPVHQPYKDSCPPPTGIMSCTEDSTAGVLDFVNKTPNAIGYAEANEPSSNDPHVYPLAIDGALPTPDQVANGKYSFWTVEHLYASMQPSMLAKDFLDFLPQYLASYRASDFAACSYAPILETDCYPPPSRQGEPDERPVVDSRPLSWLVPMLAAIGISLFVLLYLRARQMHTLASEGPGIATTDSNRPPGGGAEPN